MQDDIQKSEVEAELVDVSEFLSLRLLGRDAKVRLSDVFDATQWAGNSSLFAVSNKLGWFVAGTPTGLITSPLNHLRELQANASGEGPAQLEPKQRISLSGAPYFVGFATSHTKVVVVVHAEDTWNLEIFNSEDVCKEGSGDVKPVNSFPLGKEVVIDMQPNPSEGSDIVALLRGRKSSSSCLDMINVATSSRVTSWGAESALDESATFTCLSWSVRGKQVVVGTRGGQLVQFTPEGERKQTISPPPSYSESKAAVSVLWLENTVFHVVYGDPTSDPSDPTHDYDVFNIIFDPKAKTASYIKFTDPAPPFGLASRLSCRHYARLAGWEPAKHLIFVADGPSSDIGVVGCLNPSEASGKPTPWATLEVDETSRIALPMDDEMNETSIMGLDLDLTSTEPISNSKEAGDDAAPSPPSPILHLYTSAGLVISYHILNARDGKYPGMGDAEVTSTSNNLARPTTPTSAATPTKPTAFAGFGTGFGAFGATNTPKPGGAFSQTPATPAFGAPAFGSTTPAGTPAFGTTGFGVAATPAKPTITFGASTTPATTPAFGQTSAFGSTSAFGAGAGGGFGKFASSGSTTPAGVPAPGGGFASFGGKPNAFGGTPAFAAAASGSTTPKSEGGFAGFGSSAFGAGSTTPKSGGGFAGFGASTSAFATPSPAVPKVEAPPRDSDADLESPAAGSGKKPLPIEDDDIVSPPGSPGGASDSGIDVDALDLGGAKKAPPPGLSDSEDEDEHIPTETPSKPPPTAAFAGFGKPSAFGSSAGSGIFGAPASGSTSTSTTAKPSIGFGAFGTKGTTPSPGFGFGAGSSGATKTDGEKTGDAPKSAFGSTSGFGSVSSFGSTSSFGSSSFGSASGFGSTAFGSANKPAPAFGAASAFGATSSIGGTAAPAFGSPSAFGSAAKTSTTTSPTTPAAIEAPKSGGFAAFAAKPGFGESGDASKAGSTGGFAAFAKPGDTKSGGFAGFGSQASKAVAADEKPTEEAKPEGSDSKDKEVVEAKEERPSTPKQEKEDTSEGDKPVSNDKAPVKSAFGLPLSSPPPKAKSSSPASEQPSRIPVPKPGGLFGLPPKPEPQEPTPASDDSSSSAGPSKAQSATPPGSPDPPVSVPAKSTASPTPTSIGLGKPPAKPFGSAFNSAPMRSSPLASPPVNREDSAKQEEFAKAAPVNPLALAPKAPSPLAPAPATKPDAPAAKPANGGFLGFGFGFGKSAEPAKDKENKPQAEQWPSSFAGAMKGVGTASVTVGSPAVSTPGAAASTPTPAPATAKPTPAPSAPAPGSLFGAPAAGAPSLFAAPAPAAPTPVAPTSVAPVPAAPVPAAPVPVAPAFASPFSAPAPKPAAPSVFSAPAPVKPGSPSPFSAPVKPGSPSLFSAPTSGGTSPASSPFAPAFTSTPPTPGAGFGFAAFKPPAASTPAGASPASSVTASTASATASPVPQPALSNVEVEFNKLLEQMTNELDKFRQDSTALRQRHAQLSQARLPSPVTIQSTASPTKWGLGDLASLRHVTGFVAKEVDQLKGLNKDFAAQMTELQPGAEKVQAKRNEIARYIKAKKDPKYARLLKTRTSSPEHVESQTKLRKSIQVVRERTRQLEDFMAKQKSRIQKQKEGKRDFKVPSIDTINRTMRNIDAALAQKTDEITVLTTRVDRMKLKAPRRKASTTGAAPITLPPVESEKIKLASAAALNMERASLRLKNALLQVRTETPLNSIAVGAAVETKSAALAKSRAAQAPRAPAPAMALPPGPSSVAAPSFTLPAPSTPSGLPPKPATTPSAPFALAAAPAALPAFSPLGKDEFHVTAAYEHSSRRSDKARMHGASAKLKTPSPNISRTIPEAPITPIPAPALVPAPIPAAKSFFGATAPVAVQPARNPVPFSFASFSPSSSPSAAPPPPSGFSFFQTPAQKAAPASTTPALPPIPKWGLPANFSIPSSSAPKSSKTPKEEPEAKDEEEDGEEDDDEEDEDWTPEDGEEEEEDEEEDVSDEAEEEDEDKTV